MKEVFEELEEIRRTSMANSVDVWIPQGLAQYMRQTAEKAEHIENLLREELNSDKEKQIAVLGKKIVSLEEENRLLREALSECCCEYKNDGVPRCYARRDDPDGHCAAAKQGCLIYKLLKGGKE